MDNIELSTAIENLEQVFVNILYLKPEEMLCSPNTQHLSSIKKCLNEIFKSKLSCMDVLYSFNTDKPYFGITINPLLNAYDAIAILATDEPVVCNKYQIEFDSKLFDLGLNAEELTAMTLYEISSMLLNEGTLSEVRALIDLHVLAEDDVIRIRDSANYSQLILYALKDTFYKVSSMMFKEEAEDLLANSFIAEAELDTALLSAQEKLINDVYGASDSVRTPKTIILKWVFMIYKDMAHNSHIAKDTLLEAKQFTASLLLKQEIDKTIAAIDRIDAQTLIESCSIHRFFDSKSLYSLNEVSLFKSLKKTGLRSIEDEYYELAVRVKSMETEDDALFILRSINTRLSILEDYIYSEELSEPEKKKWTAVANNYRALRDQVVKSKIFKQKSYGLFFDYNQLDQIDESYSEEVIVEFTLSKNVKLPAELRISDEDILNNSVYKKKFEAVVKYFKDNNAPEKQLSRNVYSQYYAILGTVFGTKGARYNGKLITYLAPSFNEYCSDKQRSIIKKDIEKTLNGLDKLKEKQELSYNQSNWYADISTALNKIN